VVRVCAWLLNGWWVKSDAPSIELPDSITRVSAWWLPCKGDAPSGEKVSDTTTCVCVRDYYTRQAFDSFSSERTVELAGA
jgi:hypothetical protein